MAEGGKDDLTPETTSSELAGRRLAVCGLPENCTNDQLWDFFESRRRFGESLEVESIESVSSNQSIVTFKTAADVDKVLLKHAESPLDFYGQRLIIREYKEDGRSDSYDCRPWELSGLFHGPMFASTRSLPFSDNMSVISSNELFGSGTVDGRHSTVKFSEIKLQHTKGAGEPIEKTFALQDTQSSAVVVSYTAVTPWSPENQDTILQLQLTEKLQTDVHLEITHNTIIVTVSDKEENVRDFADVENALTDVLQELEAIVTILRIGLDENTKDVALKHLGVLVTENKGIKIYKDEEDTNVFLACHTQKDKDIIEAHINTIKQQRVKKVEKQLSIDDIFKLKAFKHNIEQQKANVIIKDNTLVIEGYEEDVLSTLGFINKITVTTYHAFVSLDAYAADMLTQPTVTSKLQTLLNQQKLKVWWIVQDRGIHIVGTENNVKTAVQGIKSFFCTEEMALPKYLIESDAVSTFKKLHTINYAYEVLFEDNMDQEKVSVKGTAEVVKKVLAGFEDLKKLCFRQKQVYEMELSKGRFVLKQLSKQIEDNTDKQFLSVSVDSGENRVTMEGTQSALEKSVRYMTTMKTLKLWVFNDLWAQKLKQIASMKEWDGIISLFENQTKIEFKTDRIENQKADVIVNSAGTDLKLNVGDSTITKSILEAGGEEVQESLEGLRTPLNFGSVVKGKSGRLKCRSVYHVVLGKYNIKETDASCKMMKNVVHECLKKASDENFQSIALPALCTGVNEYPLEKVAETMINAIVGFILQREQSSLKEIIIVFLPKDANKKTVFEESRTRRTSAVGKDAKPFSKGMAWPCHHICCVTGETEDKAREYLARLEKELNIQTAVVK